MPALDPTAALLGLAGAPLITGLTQVLKTATDLDDRRAPLLAVMLAMALNVGFALALHTSIPDGLALGIVAGLMASGIYDHIDKLSFWP